MIKYNLKCEKDHNFDAWFSDSSNFEKQNKKNLILCPKCSSTKIEKNVNPLGPPLSMLWFDFRGGEEKQNCPVILQLWFLGSTGGSEIWGSEIFRILFHLP